MKGLSQEELAAAAGVSKQTVVQLEGGKRPGRPGTMRRIAQVLGVEIASVDEFVQTPKRSKRGSGNGDDEG